MKNFEYASKEKKHFSVPRIKYEDYNIVIQALPIAPFFIAYDKIKKWAYRREQWNEKKASKILDYFLPHVLEYDKTDGVYYYCYGWHYNGYNLVKHAPITLRPFAKKFSC